MTGTVQEPSPAKNSTDAVSCHFGGFAFAPERGVLRRPDGTETVLRPKSAELLHHLARHATQVVGRDDLMDAVWSGVLVTDDSITQCVTEIRRALGVKGAPLLRTLPKRGYLLAATVTTGDPSPFEAASPHDRVVAGGAAAPPVAASLPAAVIRHRWLRPATWLGAGLGLASLAGTLAWWNPTSETPPLLPAQASLPEAGAAAARRRSMLVLPFSDAGGDPVPGGLADAITEELIAGFGASYYFTVIGRGTAFGYRGRTPDLRQLGREQDVRYVLDGTLRRFGGQVLISIHLQDTASGSQLWADRFEMPLADPAGLPRLVFARIQRNLAFEVNAIETRQPLIAAGPNQPDVTDLLIRGDAVWKAL